MSRTAVRGPAADPYVDESEAPRTARSGVVPRPSEDEPTARAMTVLRSLHVYEALAEAAEQHAEAGEREEALHIIEDALVLLQSVRDKRPFARVLLGIGECLLDLDCPRLAAPQLAEAIALADALPDTRVGARARLALGRAWMPIGHPSARDVLAQAIELFVALGDEKGASKARALVASQAAPKKT